MSDNLDTKEEELDYEDVDPADESSSTESSDGRESGELDENSDDGVKQKSTNKNSSIQSTDVKKDSETRIVDEEPSSPDREGCQTGESKSDEVDVQSESVKRRDVRSHSRDRSHGGEKRSQAHDERSRSREDDRKHQRHGNHSRSRDRRHRRSHSRSRETSRYRRGRSRSDGRSREASRYHSRSRSRDRYDRRGRHERRRSHDRYDKQQSDNRDDRYRRDKGNKGERDEDKENSRSAETRKRKGDVDDKEVKAAEPVSKKKALDVLTGRTGGAYIPPAKLRAMQAQITDKASDAYQRISWEALKKSINGLVNKVNISNLQLIVVELIGENLVRGRGLVARSLIQAQSASPTFTHVYAALLAVINSKFPEIGELVLKRLVMNFKRGFKRNDKKMCIASVGFIAHLINQQVCHEVLALEILLLLLENATDDSVEVAVGFLKECGQKLTQATPRGTSAIFDQLRNTPHTQKLEKRTEYMIDVMMAVRKDGFKEHPAVLPELDIVDEEDQITHMMQLMETYDTQPILDVFKSNPNFEEDEEKYKEIKKAILDEDSDDSDGSDSASGSEAASDSDDSTHGAKVTIEDHTETNLMMLRRTIYLTLQSSLDFEEAAHKLLKLQLKPGQEVELCSMILDCCAQLRTYEKFFGLLAQRFCLLDKKYVEPFEQIFQEQYSSAHRLETNKLRNVARFFGHLLHSDAISWGVLECIKLTEDDTTSSSRVFIKILFQELSEFLGLPKLHARLQDPTLSSYFEGLFPRDHPKHTRFAINFFTMIGLGGLTEELREHLKNMPRQVMEQTVEVEESDSSSSSSASSSSSSSSEDSEVERRKRKKKKEEMKRHSKENRDERRMREKQKDHSSLSKRDRRNEYSLRRPLYQEESECEREDVQREHRKALRSVVHVTKTRATSEDERNMSKDMDQDDSCDERGKTHGESKKKRKKHRNSSQQGKREKDGKCTRKRHDSVSSVDEKSSKRSKASRRVDINDSDKSDEGEQRRRIRMHVEIEEWRDSRSASKKGSSSNLRNLDYKCASADDLGRKLRDATLKSDSDVDTHGSRKKKSKKQKHQREERGLERGDGRISGSKERRRNEDYSPQQGKYGGRKSKKDYSKYSKQIHDVSKTIKQEKVSDEESADEKIRSKYTGRSKDRRDHSRHVERVRRDLRSEEKNNQLQKSSGGGGRRRELRADHQSVDRRRRSHDRARHANRDDKNAENTRKRRDSSESSDFEKAYARWDRKENDDKVSRSRSEARPERTTERRSRRSASSSNSDTEMKSRYHKAERQRREANKERNRRRRSASGSNSDTEMKSRREQQSERQRREANEERNRRRRSASSSNSDTEMKSRRKQRSERQRREANKERNRRRRSASSASSDIEMKPRRDRKNLDRSDRTVNTRSEKFTEKEKRRSRLVEIKVEKSDSSSEGSSTRANRKRKKQNNKADSSDSSGNSSSSDSSSDNSS